MGVYIFMVCALLLGKCLHCILAVIFTGCQVCSRGLFADLLSCV